MPTTLPNSEISARLEAIPGVGARLARRIHDELHVETLEDLECAAHDGRLAAIDGVGSERTRAVRDWLDATLSRQRPVRQAPSPWPSVARILELDREYRELAAEHRLPQIAPRRFNPHHRAWLPVWNVERDGWSYTVLYSNTAQAHRLGKTDDWVVVVFERDDGQSQATVVTEYQGSLRGLRVVRGREAECKRHYGAMQVPDEVKRWFSRRS